MKRVYLLIVPLKNVKTFFLLKRRKEQTTIELTTLMMAKQSKYMHSHCRHNTLTKRKDVKEMRLNENDKVKRHEIPKLNMDFIFCSL